MSHAGAHGLARASHGHPQGMYIVSKDYPRASDAQCPPTLCPTCTQLPTPSRRRHHLQTCTDPLLLTHTTPPAHLPTLTSPRRTCTPLTLMLALVLTCPRSQRRRGGDDAMTIATAPSSWRCRYHPLSPSRSLRAHPVLAPPPLALALALATHARPTRRHPSHSLHMSTRPPPSRLSLPCSQRRRGGDTAMTIATAPSSWRHRYHPLSPSHSLRAHPVLPPPPLALATRTHATRHRPPHGAPAQPNKCPCACPSSRSQR
jgi:hypothetical protein